MSEYIHKSHNVTVLLYHVVLPAKYRRAVFDDQVDEVLKEICLEIAQRYQMKFLEIGTDKDHVHFLVQSVPTYTTRCGFRGDSSGFPLKEPMMHEVPSMAGFALRGNDLTGEVIDMVSARVATAQCAGEVTIGGPERRDQRRQ